MLCKKVSCKVAQKIAYVSVLIKISSVNKKNSQDHPPRRKSKKGRTQSATALHPLRWL